LLRTEIRNIIEYTHSIYHLSLANHCYFVNVQSTILV